MTTEPFTTVWPLDDNSAPALPSAFSCACDLMLIFTPSMLMSPLDFMLISEALSRRNAIRREGVLIAIFVYNTDGALIVTDDH